MFKARSSLISFTISLLTLVAAGCGDDNSRVVHIKAGDVATLEASLADPTLADYKLELAAGVYPITKTLSMQPGQSLVGQNKYTDRDGDGVWDPRETDKDPADGTNTYLDPAKETVIDLSHRAGMLDGLQMNVGNSLENLTVRGGGRDLETGDGMTPRFMVLVEGTGVGTAPARVVNCIIEHGYHGFSFSAKVAGTYALVFQGNIVRDYGEGVGIGASGVDHSILTATVLHNRIVGGLFPGSADGQLGLNMLMFGSDSDAHVVSTGNIIEKNTSMGVFLVGGFSFGGGPTDPPMGLANRNKLDWVSNDDKIWRNGSTLTATSGALGGIHIGGVLDFNFAGTLSSDNKVSLHLNGTQLAKPGTAFADQNHYNDQNGNFAMDVSALSGSFNNCMGVGSGNTITAAFQGVTGATDDPANPCPMGNCTTLFFNDNLNLGTGANTAAWTPADPAAFLAANHHLAAPDHQNALGPACTTP